MYEKISTLGAHSYATDCWRAYDDFLPPSKHIRGKKHIQSIESFISQVRYFLARFARNALDWASKKIVGWQLSPRNKTVDWLEALSNAVNEQFLKEICEQAALKSVIMAASRRP